ncbi:GD20516 [Drosophila simulans]|uniref:GD20516 n=1 Tax=Drosophila simulans TaxID=7240 RepID=B4R1V0_DROSI|nr:GD20516 [Drosophila simulans]
MVTTVPPPVSLICVPTFVNLPGVQGSIYEFAQHITQVATSTFVYLKAWLISG